MRAGWEEKANGDMFGMTRRLRALEKGLVSVMATIEDLNAEIATVKADASAAAARVVAADAALQAQIDALKAAGGADTAPQIAALEEIRTTLTGIDPAAPPS